jgi:hypothetical protein
MVLLVVASGCAFVGKTVLSIVMRIGTEIIVDAGADYVRSILSPKAADGDPTLTVTYTDAAGDGVGANFAIEGVNQITLRDFEGDIHVVRESNGLAITVAAGTTATLEIGSATGGGGGHIEANPKAQAVTIAGIISWSSRSRATLRDALNDLDACRSTASATDALNEVAGGRAAQVDSLESIEVAALPDGEAIRSTLVRALRDSLAADRAFIRWGERVGTAGCGHDDNYDEGMSQSHSATAAKKVFVNMWNPIAGSYGLPAYEEGQV